MPGVSITCPKCGLTSFNEDDVKRRYCGACNLFHDDDRELVPVRVEMGTMEVTEDMEIVELVLNHVTVEGHPEITPDQVTFVDQPTDPKTTAALRAWFKQIYGRPE